MQFHHSKINWAVRHGSNVASPIYSQWAKTSGQTFGIPNFLPTKMKRFYSQLRTMWTMKFFSEPFQKIFLFWNKNSSFSQAMYILELQTFSQDFSQNNLRSFCPLGWPLSTHIHSEFCLASTIKAFQEPTIEQQQQQKHIIRVQSSCATSYHGRFDCLK